jgi:hypothetical protein
MFALLLATFLGINWPSLKVFDSNVKMPAALALLTTRPTASAAAKAPNRYRLTDIRLLPCFFIYSGSVAGGIARSRAGCAIAATKSRSSTPRTEKFTEYPLPPYTFPRVVRMDPKSGTTEQYLMPSETNMRTSTTPVSFWVGSNHAHALVKVEPLD